MKDLVSKIKFVFPIISIASLLQFCAPTASTSTSTTVYEEDLSIHRPAYHADEETDEDSAVVPVEGTTETQYIEPSNDLKSELDTVLYRIMKSRQDIRYVDGFSIQLYSGNSRDKANRVKVRTYDVLDEIRPRVSYDQPNYKVRVGEYYSRLEANADFVKLQEHFSRAVLIPVKIKIPE